MTRTVSPPPEPRPSLRDLPAESAGLSDEKALWHIRRRVFPLRRRAADTLRFLASGHALTAEWDLVRDLAGCTSTDAISAAFSDYRHSPVRMAGPLRAILGEPRQKTAVLLYRKLNDEWRVRRAGVA